MSAAIDAQTAQMAVCYLNMYIDKAYTFIDES